MTTTVAISQSQIAKAPTIQAIPIDVLDKIRAELHATAEMHEDGDYYLREKWIDEIIDKYRAESDDEWDRVVMKDIDGNTHIVTFKKEIEG